MVKMKDIFIKTAIITTIIFAIGIWLGLWMGESKISSLEGTILELEQEINNAELQYMMIETLEKDVSCNYLIQTAGKLGKESGEMAEEVNRYENTQKIEDKPFYELKRKYTNTLIRNWLTIEKIKKTCHGNYSIILYFYSNKECDQCQEQGIVLTYLKDKLEQDLLVFALDTDLNVTAVDSLIDAYKIKEYPSIVINGDVEEGFQSKQEIIEELCDFNSNLNICQTT